MHQNKRRSSIRRIAADDHDRTAPNLPVRQKKRISFSAKKSIREFSGNEEPKTWDNSYEVSDHANASAETAAQKLSIASAQTFINSTANKENEGHHVANTTAQKLHNSSAHMFIHPAGNKENEEYHVAATTSLYAAPTSMAHCSVKELCNYATQLETSMDITLLDKDTSARQGMVTFTLFENETEILRRRSYSTDPTMDFMHELNRNNAQEAICNAADKTNVEHEDVMESSPQVVKHGAAQKRRDLTIFVDESMAIESETTLGTNSRRLTQHQTQLMEISVAGKSRKSFDANNAPLCMELSSSLWQTKKSTEEVVDENCDISMATENFSEKLKRISLLVESEDSGNLEEEFRASIAKSAAPNESNCETLAMEMSVHATEPLLVEEQQRKPRQTILFNGANETLEKTLMSKTIAEAQPMTVETETEKGTALKTISTSAAKKNRPKVTVRTLSTVTTPIAMAKLEKQRLQRYQKKLDEQLLSAQKAKSPLETLKSAHENSGNKAKLSLDFLQYANDNDNNLTPDLSSPLLAPEYAAAISSTSKRPNFRQLNDDLECGKLQLFPESIIMNESSKHETHLLPNLKEDNRAPKKRPTRFSEADDMLLDNTSFLARAKLGDETASRNSSKCSNSKSRETIHFNEEIEASFGGIQLKEVDGKHTRSEENQHCLRESMFNNINIMDITADLPASQDLPPSQNNRTDSILDIIEMNLDESKQHDAQKQRESHCQKDATLDYVMQDAIHTTGVISFKELPAVGNQNPPNRKTIYYDTDIEGEAKKSLQNQSLGQEVLQCVEENFLQPLPATNNKNSQVRKTIYFDADIDSETEKPTHQKQYKQDSNLEQKAMLCTEVIPPLVGYKSLPNRKTIHLGTDIEEEAEDAIRNRSKNSFTLGQEIPQSTEVACSQTPPVESNKKAQLRKTIYFDEKIDSDVEKSAPQPQQCKQDWNLEQQAILSTKSIPSLMVNKNAPTRKTIHFNTDIEPSASENNINASCNASLKSTTLDTTKAKSLNAAKLALKRQGMHHELDDTFTKMLKETRNVLSTEKNKTIVYKENNDIDISPVFQNDNQARRRFEGTPHRSVLEFECIEKETKEEQERFDQLQEAQQQQPTRRRQTTYERSDIVLDVSGLQPLDARDTSNYCSDSPAINALTGKRLTSNLTPILRYPKKRQTVLFNNCDLEETINAKCESNATCKSKLFDAERTNIVPTNMTIEMESFIDEANNDVEKRLEAEAKVEADMEMECVEKSIKIEEPANMSLSMQLSESYEEVKSFVPITNVNIKTETVSTPTLDITKPRAKSIANMEPSSPLERKSTIFGTSRIPVRFDGSVKKCQTILTESPAKRDCSKADIYHDVDQSLDTIQMPRRATTFVQRKDSIKMKLPCDMNETSLLAPKQPSLLYVNEDNPITISDVSVFYMTQSKSGIEAQRERDVVDIEEIEEDEEEAKAEAIKTTEQSKVVNRRSSFAYNTLTYFPETFINLSSDVADEIEKTQQITLVESFLDEEVEQQPEIIQVEDENIEEEERVVEQAQVKAEPKSMPAKNITLCGKCRKCQTTLINETDFSRANESSMLRLSPWKWPEIGFERLERLRKRPNLAQINEYWERKSLETSLQFNLSENDSNDKLGLDIDDSMEEEVELKADGADQMISNYREGLERALQELALKYDTAPKEKSCSFVERLDDLLSTGAPNWIFNYQRQFSGILLFSHKKIITFELEIHYEEMDDFGTQIKIRNIELNPNRTPKKNWKPIDYIMDFQLNLELPHHLHALCAGDTEQDVFKMLQDFDHICVNVKRLCYDLWRIAIRERASLIRDDANRIFVQKILRQVCTNEDAYPRVKKTEILIEIFNVKRLCYNNIANPPLYFFREDIQFLPVGLDFLREFLIKPIEYLKT